MTKIPRFSRELISQGARFVAVGFLNAVVGLGLFLLLYNLLGVDYVLANAIGYGCGLVNSFLWNKRWTFKSSKNPGREVAFFLLFFAVSYGLNLSSVVFCVRKLGLDPNIAQFCGIAVYTSTNFFGNKYVTFR